MDKTYAYDPSKYEEQIRNNPALAFGAALPEDHDFVTICGPEWEVDFVREDGVWHQKPPRKVPPRAVGDTGVIYK